MLGPLWRKETDSACICLEPAFVKNGLNDQPILIPAGEIWSAVFQIGRRWPHPASKHNDRRQAVIFSGLAGRLNAYRYTVSKNSISGRYPCHWQGTPRRVHRQITNATNPSRCAFTRWLSGTI